MAGRAYGPSVRDMEAGLVMIMFVLAAFQKLCGASGPLVGLFIGDEKIGSPEGPPRVRPRRGARVLYSTASPAVLLAGLSRHARAACSWELDAQGCTAHPGGSFEANISVIGELVRKITAWHALTDLTRSITLDVGLVSGGQSESGGARCAKPD